MSAIPKVLGEAKDFGSIVKYLNIAYYPQDIRAVGITSNTSTHANERGNKAWQAAYESTNKKAKGILFQVNG